MITSLVGQVGSWSHTLLNDLRWCCARPKLADYATYDLSSWISLLRSGSPWSRLLRLFRMYLKSPFANLSVTWDSDKVVAPIVMRVSCDLCTMKFRSEQALALHRYKVHGFKNYMRQFVQGTHCPVCLKQFWTRERIINHLRCRSHVCRNNLLLAGPCLSVDQADDLDALEYGANASRQRKGQRRHQADLPVVRLQGPLRAIFTMPGCDSEHHASGIGHNHW